MFVLLVSLSVFLLQDSVAGVPEWQPLGCQPGHKYLFSFRTRTWQDAMDECALYNGWLLRIGTRREQNCLIRYAREAGLSAVYYHDGTDAETEGVYVHGTNGEDMGYVHWHWSHAPRGTPYNFLTLSTVNNDASGAWADAREAETHNFICEAIIEQ